MKITVINNQDDWMAVYIDGTKVEEGHRVNWDRVFKAAGIEFEEKVVLPSFERDIGYYEKNFPDKLTIS